MAIIYDLAQYRAMAQCLKQLDEAEEEVNDLTNPDDWQPDFADLDFLGMSEAEAEEARTNIEQTQEDVSPDALEKEGNPLLNEDGYVNWGCIGAIVFILLFWTGITILITRLL